MAASETQYRMSVHHAQLGTVRCLDTDFEWLINLEILRVFVGLHPYRVNPNDAYNTFPIGKWASHQRLLNADCGFGTLSKFRVDWLNTIRGWDWGLNPDEIWEKNYARLWIFCVEHKRPPRPDEAELGAWVERLQRGVLSRLGLGFLRQEEFEALEQCPHWTWLGGDKKRRRELNPASESTSQLIAADRASAERFSAARCQELSTQWLEMNTLLLKFIHGGGGLPADRDVVHNDFALGVWVSEQRIKYSGRGNLNPVHKRLLDEIPEWDWAIGVEDEWYLNLDLAKSYMNSTGQLPYPNTWYYAIDIGAWVWKQRFDHHKLSFAKKTALDNIDGWRWA